MARRLDTQGYQVRQKILSSARQCIIERGVDDTSLKDIAKTAGISSGTLYYYYPTKSSLIFEITDQYFDQLTHELLERVTSKGHETEIRPVIRSVMQTIVGDAYRGKLHHYLIEEAVSSDPTIRIRFKEKYREWRQMIEQGLAGFISDAEKRQTVSHILLAVLDGLIIQSILGVEDLPLDKIADNLAGELTLVLPARSSSIQEE
jgi:AcrR family transcriptional regulator